MRLLSILCRPSLAAYSILLLLFPALALSVHIEVSVPTSPLLLHPSSLPASTVATLTTLLISRPALLSAANSFSFRNVSAGSYLFDVRCPTHAFAPLRVDVHASVGVAEERVEAWTTFRGHEWDNRGEKIAVSTVAGGAVRTLEARVLGGKSYYMERAKFSPMSILQNPMILMAGVSMLIVFGMPYLMDNMDPEMRKEFEERNKGSSLSGLVGGQQSGDFDAAAWLAGQPKKTDGNTERGVSR